MGRRPCVGTRLPAPCGLRAVVVVGRFSHSRCLGDGHRV
ncbi:hypothetical protein ATKI12_0055 [Kitasatospora sp. Ki12]